MLKEELGLTALGKRMRLNNAINELRRPPSISSSREGGLQGVYTPPSALSPSVSQFPHGMAVPGGYPHIRNQSLGSSIAMSSTLNSPTAPAYTTAPTTSATANGFNINQPNGTYVNNSNYVVASPTSESVESPGVNSGSNESHQQEKEVKSGGGIGAVAGAVGGAIVGLGIAGASMFTGRNGATTPSADVRRSVISLVRLHVLVLPYLITNSDQ